MPSFRKISPAEAAAIQPTRSDRARVAQEYDAYLADFVIGDYGRAEPIEGEQRKVVRSRLHAAARRRGLHLQFRPGSGPLTFRIEALPAPVVSPTPVGAAQVPAQLDEMARHNPAQPRPPRPPHRRETSSERYRAVLPRWMREGQQSGRRNKRRVR